jgi:hypothetical protein
MDKYTCREIKPVQWAIYHSILVSGYRQEVICLAPRHKKKQQITRRTRRTRRLVMTLKASRSMGWRRVRQVRRVDQGLPPRVGPHWMK